MNVKDAVTMLTNPSRYSAGSEAEALRTLSDERLILTGKPCAVCKGTGQVGRGDPVGCWRDCIACEASGWELVEVFTFDDFEKGISASSEEVQAAIARLALMVKRAEVTASKTDAAVAEVLARLEEGQEK